MKGRKSIFPIACSLLAVLLSGCGGADTLDDSTTTMSTVETTTTAGETTTSTDSTTTSTDTTDTTDTTSDGKTNPGLAIDMSGDATFDQGSASFSVTSDSPGPTTVSADGSCSVSGDTIVFEHAGTCEVTASQTGTDTYAGATVSATVTIGKGIRTVDAPSEFTWADLPQELALTPDAAPPPTYSSLNPDICSVSAGGVIDTSGPDEGRAGTCRISVRDDGNSDWEALDTVLDVEIGRPTVRIRLRAGQETTIDYDTQQELTIVLDVIENDGFAYVSAISDGVSCNAFSEMDELNGVVTVNVSFFEAGTCQLEFSADGPGVFDFGIEIPAPVVLTAT